MRARGGWLVVLLLGLVGAKGDVRVPAIFSEYAVLQRSAATAVWGAAQPGEKVEVTWGDAKGQVATGADGKWRVVLDLAKAGAEAKELVVAGKNRVVIPDVLVGEVWLTSGQSNMQLPLNATTEADAEIERSANPNLRWFQAESGKAFREPQEEVKGRWFVAGPETAATCSAVSYYFGKRIAADLGTPVGLVLTAVGGTTIQSWISRETLEGDEGLRVAMAGLKKPKRMPPIATPSFYYNQLIHPLGGLTLRGILWYQGEAHFSQGEFYGVAFPPLIRDWRKRFGQGDVPFYFCQLPNLDKKTPDANAEGWVAEVREGQEKGLTEKATGEAVLIDVGGEDLHPGNKQVVGDRLAALAEAGTYGRKVVADGPRCIGAKRNGAQVVVTFSGCEGGLVSGELPAGAERYSPESAVQGYALRGADGNWVWARAEIAGETVRVWADKVPDPVAVRYGWANNPTCNLVNKAGLPAGPFRIEGLR